MDTVRVNICYRPLRICWAINAGDRGAFRSAVSLSNTMWGGRYNPIVIADRAEEAANIAEVFRPDLIMPIGTSDALNAFKARFSHLINPLFPPELFIGTMHEEARAQILDIHNALVQLSNSPALDSIKEKGMRLYSWEANDPLAEVLLMHLGAYPDVAETRIDYRHLVLQATDASEHPLASDAPLPADLFEHPSIAYLSRHGLRRHYGIQSYWDFSGFYLGDASNLDDLVNCWNLRATDTAVLFVDRGHLDRYQHVIPAWSKVTNETISRRKFEHQRSLAIWTQQQSMPKNQAEHEACLAQLKAIFGEGPFTLPSVAPLSWNGGNLKAPMMILGETAQLGVLVTEYGNTPKLSFSLGDKPYYSDIWFHSQHLVASLSFIGGLYADDLHTLDPPYIPELDEFYARSMHFEYNKLRIEPERIGLVIDANDSDTFVRALPVTDLVERIFKLVGFSAQPSSAGLITRQLITQLGNLRGGLVFKIPGVRRLLKTYGPTDPFTKKSALCLIGGKDQDNPAASFKDHEDLFIEARPLDTKLTASDTFTYLVERGLFRIGAQLACPHCRMSSWIPLDTLKQRITCDMCGREFDATRQLVNVEWHYRRSGLLGVERNSQGAVPVILTLQQLENNLGHGFRHHHYSTSLDLKPAAPEKPTCEVDFVWLVNEGGRTHKVTVILGECKDRGGKKSSGKSNDAIDANDIANLRALADSFPAKRFDVFVLLAKLSGFTDAEIEVAKTLNDRWHKRVILLSVRELEQAWSIYKRTQAELNMKLREGSAEDLAISTAAIYFPDSPVPRPNNPVQDTNDAATKQPH
ncbi:MAG: hypothetical protein WAU56_18065 [Steroidobacteraceae bacterium]